MSPNSTTSTLIFLWLMHTTTAFFKICNRTSPCTSETITCDDGDIDCHLLCDSESDPSDFGPCTAVKYYCNGQNNECELTCNKHQSCYALKLYSNISTTVVCTGTDPCVATNDLNPFEVNVIGNNNPVSVNVTCIGANWKACQFAHINLYGSNAGNEANILCKNTGNTFRPSCRSVNMQCEFANSQCTAECETFDGASCLTPSSFPVDDNTLTCPYNGIGTTCNIINYTQTNNFVYGVTFVPTATPTEISNSPSMPPSNAPSISPTVPPTNTPSMPPSNAPSISPTVPPTNTPSMPPSNAPSISPTVPPSNAPSISPTLNPTPAPTDNPTLAPSINPSTNPSNAPSISPTIAPSNNPSRNPSKTPSNSPSVPPTINPSINPSIAPTFAPSISPSSTPSLPPTLNPSDSPTARPTYISYSNNIQSNYIMINNFGINGFILPAAIGKCMNEYFMSDTYIQYECMDQNTVIHNIYNSIDCNINSIVSDSTKYYNKSINDFKCDGEDTFIELELFSSPQCPNSQKSIVFVADGICTPYDTTNINNKHFSLYCNDYESTQDSNIYGFVWFEYFNDKCSIYAHEQSKLIEEESGTCDSQQPLFENNNDISIKIIDCFTINETDTIDTTIITTKKATTTIVTTGNIEETTGDGLGDINDANDNTKIANISGYIVVGGCLLFPMIFILIAFMFHKKRKGTDRPGYISLFKFFTSIGDFYTDAIFALTLYSVYYDW
eukprot:468205_1